jgi:hypothetical protein
VLGKIQVRSRNQQLKINQKWLNLARGKKLSPSLLGCVIVGQFQPLQVMKKKKN